MVSEPIQQRTQFRNLSNITKLLMFLALMIAVGALWSGWKLLSLFLRAFAGSPAPVQAAVIAGSATISVSVASLILNARYQKRREIETEHRKQKADIYEEFMEFLFGVIMREKLNKEAATETEIMEFITKFSRRMIVWGSDEVVKEYIKFRAFFVDVTDADPKATMKAIENLFYAIRRDLGHANKNLNDGDLLRLFINDVDELWRDPV